MKRRVVCAWLPHLAAERMLKHAADRDRPFVVVAEARSALRLCSLNRAAREAGLSPGMALADARAILPDLATAERDDAFLRALGRWAQRFTPSVTLEASEGADGTLMLDASGCAHLFGGEEPMLAEIEAGLARFGLTVRMGLADTKGGAWALARYGTIRIAPPGETRTVLDPLPVAALGFEAEACVQLQRLGLHTAGEVARLPRASLAKRFGVETVRWIDRAFGAEAEPMVAMAQTRPHAVRLSLPEPISTTDQVMEALGRLLARLCERLEREGQGARRLRLTAHRADGGRDACEIGLMRPSRDVAAITALFERGVAGLDSGFGIDMLRLVAVQVEPCAPAQVSIDGPSGEDALDALLARLGNRLGFETLERLAPAESHIPERSWLRFAAAHADRGMVGEGDWPRSPAPRPITMVPPEPLRIEEPSHPRHPPARFLWRGTLFEMTNAIGPERIAPEWWLDDPAWRTGARDYWRVQAVQPATAYARRLWLFHTPQVPSGMPGQDHWFVQGLFA